MPSKREVGPDDRERILQELRTVSPLTRLDITDEPGLSYAYASELLA